ncbi:MAG: chorismate mutase, partial [Polaribacter sp.]|nr:chorismate mutase [Polaribacter sp.]
NRFPDLPLICDPSHITGNRDMVFDVSQTALDLNFDGLMIESHFDPENAWSDAAQQVTPTSLIQMMEDLKIRKETETDSGYRESLNNLRAQINVVDAQLIEMMGKRMKVADKIGALKKEKNVAVLQSRRWNEILGNMILEGESKGLSEEFVLKMFKAIHQESINHQEKIIKNS